MKKMILAGLAVGGLMLGMAGVVGAVTGLPILSPGWNLVGLMVTADQPAMDVTKLGDVISVWKWATVNGNKTWAVYLPGEGSQGDYAVSKGFGELYVIEPGEGFWVNVPNSPVTTTTAAGYVTQGGLTWTPNNMAALWAAYPNLPSETGASAWCAGSNFLGHTGWRLPTQTELTGLYTSGVLNGKGYIKYIKSYDGPSLYSKDWNLNWTWTSTKATSDGLTQYSVDLSTGDSGFYIFDACTNFVTCVY